MEMLWKGAVEWERIGSKWRMRAERWCTRARWNGALASNRVRRINGIVLGVCRIRKAIPAFAAISLGQAGIYGQFHAPVEAYSFEPHAPSSTCIKLMRNPYGELNSTISKVGIWTVYKKITKSSCDLGVPHAVHAMRVDRDGAVASVVTGRIESLEGVLGKL